VRLQALFTAAAAEALFGALRTEGFAFAVELLLRAEAAGYRVVEVPVNWVDQQNSKVSVLGSGPAMLLQLLAARWRVRRR
jgi:dolichyl-phosphate beta-glucosyltransferase